MAFNKFMLVFLVTFDDTYIICNNDIAQIVIFKGQEKVLHKGTSLSAS